MRVLNIIESQKNWSQKYQLSFRDYFLFLFCAIAYLTFAPIFGPEDFKHLKWFAKNLAKGEFTGVVLYSGEHTLRFGEGFYAVPLAVLGVKDKVNTFLW